MIALLTTIRNEGFENHNTLDENITRYQTFLKVHLRYKANTKAGKEARKLAQTLQRFLKNLIDSSEGMKPSELLDNEPLKTELFELKALMDATLTIVNDVKTAHNNSEVAQKEKEAQRRLAKDRRKQNVDDARKVNSIFSKNFF